MREILEHYSFLFKATPVRHIDIPRLGVKSEQQPLDYATAIWDGSGIDNLHHSLQQHWIPNPLSEARD